jgi:hypothetical protein
MPDEERPTVPAIHPYAKVGVVRAAEMDCSDTCANHPRGCAICDGEIMYAPAEE